MLTDEATRLRSRRNAESAEMRGLKRQIGGADGRRNAVGSRSKAVGRRRDTQAGEMRGGKRQIGGADGRRNAVGSRRNAPGMEMRRAELYGRWRAAVSRRQLAAPAPLLSIINLARALFPTAGAFSLCSPPRSLQGHNSSPAHPSRPRASSPTRPLLLLLAHHLPSRYTAFLPLLRTAAARSVYSYLLLSAKLQNATISLSAMPINRRCGLLFGKVSPLYDYHSLAVR